MNEEGYMRRCFALAELGAGQVSPNPLVGAVLVHNERIIGEGWHRQWGGPHAEVACIRSVSAENQALIPYSTLFCNLEPCAHHGKTPPCADLILEHRIPRVVVANTDPNPLVAGKGIHKLRDAGVNVKVGVLEDEGRSLNRFFFTWIEQSRPFITLKWAQSADGFLGKEGARTPVSEPASLRLVHRWRAAHDAILVGAKTAVVDNPRLDVRYYFGRNPLRIVFGLKGEIPPGHHLLDDTVDTWILGNAELPVLPAFNRTRIVPTVPSEMLKTLLQDLKVANCSSLLVEGGAKTLQFFIDADCWDEIRILENERRLKTGITAPGLPLKANLKEETRLGADVVRIFAR